MELLKILFYKNANVNKTDEFNRTALHFGMNKLKIIIKTNLSIFSFNESRDTSGTC